MAIIPGPQNVPRAQLIRPRRVTLDEGADAIGAGLQSFGRGVTRLGGRLQQREAEQARAQARTQAQAEERAQARNQALRDAETRRQVQRGAVDDADAEARAMEAFENDFDEIQEESRRREASPPPPPSAVQPGTAGGLDVDARPFDIAGEFGRRSSETIERLIEPEPDPEIRARRADRLNRLRLVFAADAARAAQAEDDRDAEAAIARALDAFEAGIGRNPSRLSLLEPLALEAIDDPAARLSPERRADLKTGFHGRAMRAAIQGIARVDPARAQAALRHGALDEDGANRIADALSPAEIKEQRRLVKIFTDDSGRRAAEDQARIARDRAARERQAAAILARNIDGGAAGLADIEAARLSGVLSDAGHAALGARVAQRAERLTDEAAAMTLVQHARDTGLGLDPFDPGHAQAADTWWESVIRKPFLQTRPADRPAFIEAALDGLGVVPDGAARATAAMWRSGDPNQQIAAARIADLIDRARDQPVAVTLPDVPLPKGANPRFRAQTRPNHPLAPGVDPRGFAQTLLDRRDGKPVDIPESLRPLLERAPKIPDLFDRHERIAQRFALDLIDLGIPPAKAIERAEVRAVTLANEAKAGGVGASGEAGEEGQNASFTSGTARDAAGKIVRSFDQNRADAAANPKDNAASSEMFEDDFTEGDRDVTGGAISRFASKIAGPLDEAQDERQRTKEKSRAEKERKREEEKEKLRKNPVDRVSIDRNRDLLESRIDGRGLLNVFLVGKGKPGFSKQRMERIGESVITPIAQGLLIYDKMTNEEMKRYNADLKALRDNGVLTSGEFKVIQDLKREVIAKDRRSLRFLSQEELENLMKGLKGVATPTGVTGLIAGSTFTTSGTMVGTGLGAASLFMSVRADQIGNELDKRRKAEIQRLRRGKAEK